jgi:hypothetical protein
MDTKEPDDKAAAMPRVFFRLLDEARTISERVMDRLHALSDQFPTALPSELVEQVERIHFDPSHERRRFPRLRDSMIPANVSEPADLIGWSSALVIDRSPGGLALLLDTSMQEGTVLLVWFACEGEEEAWLPVEVRHCRSEGEKWLVGAEFTGSVIEMSGDK